MDSSLDTQQPLETYGHNLTQMASRETFVPFTRDEPIFENVFHSLLREGTARFNPLLLDQSEQRRSQILRDLARQMLASDVPTSLSAKQIIALDMDAVFVSFLPPLPVADLTHLTLEEREERFVSRWTPEQKQQAQIVLSRLQAFFQAAIRHRETILIAVDSLHWLCGANERCPVTIVDLLLPAFARRELQIIGACTLAQYQEGVFHIAGLERSFQRIHLS